MNITKDILHLILSHLLARDALALRATCKRLNSMIAHSQLYWFYQYKAKYGMKGSKYHPTDEESAKIAGRKAVHIRPMTRNCLQSMKYHFNSDDKNAGFEKLKEMIPGLEVEYENMIQDALTPYPFPQYQPTRQAICERIQMSLIYKYAHYAMQIDSIQTKCRLPHHIEILYNEVPEVGLQTKDYVNDDGLYMYQFLYMCYDEMRVELKKIAHTNPQTVTNLQNQIDVLNAKIRTLEHVKWVHSNYEKLKKDMSASPFLRKRNQMKAYHKRSEVEKCFGIEEPVKKRKSKKSDK